MKKIGRYEIVGRLGRGGMSTVYKARAPITGRLVALKQLQPRDEIFVELAGEQRLREIFVEEARIMGEIRHDNVAEVIDCDEDDGQPYIVLEYYSHSVGELIGEAYRVEDPSRIVSLEMTRSCLLQALQGLERLHFAGIIHRDIKPFNLMLTCDGRVKIIDFGLSRVRGEEKMAIPGMQIGSPYYGAPELGRKSAAVDGRADIYSLGVLAYRMLTGYLVDRLAQRGPDRKITVPPPSQINPAVDDLWDKLVLKALAQNPDDRFASASEMRAVLESTPLPQAPVCAVAFSPDSVSGDEREFEQEIVAQPSTGLEENGSVPVSSWGTRQVRREPVRVMLKDICSQLELDALLRPLHYSPVRKRDGDVSGGSAKLLAGCAVVDDSLTRLRWQYQGSGFPLDWHQAHAYVAMLNRTGYLGLRSWRLPTIEELRTILVPPVYLSRCSAQPLLAPELRWVWSADMCNKRQAWAADIQDGYFCRLDREGGATVCCVSSLDMPEGNM